MRPILPLYLCTRTDWPLIHFPATSLSPHSCTVGLNGFVSRPKALGALSSALFYLYFPVFVLCIVDCLTLRNAKVTNLSLSSIVWHLFTDPVFISALPVATLSQTHPRFCQLHLCFHLVWLHGSFFHFQSLLWRSGSAEAVADGKVDVVCADQVRKLVGGVVVGFGVQFPFLGTPRLLSEGSSGTFVPLFAQSPCVVGESVAVLFATPLPSKDQFPKAHEVGKGSGVVMGSDS